MAFGLLPPGQFEDVVKGVAKQIDEFQKEKILKDKSHKTKFLRDIRRIEKIRDELFLSDDEALLNLLEQLIKTTAKEFTKLRKQ